MGSLVLQWISSWWANVNWWCLWTGLCSDTLRSEEGEVTSDCKSLHNDNIHNYHYHQILLEWLKRGIWDAWTYSMRRRDNKYMTMEKPKRNKSFGRFRLSCECSIEMDSNGVVKTAYWFHDRDKRGALVNTGMKIWRQQKERNIFNIWVIVSTYEISCRDYLFVNN